MSIKHIVEQYEETIRELQPEENPGQIRSKKGRLVEFIAEQICTIAWSNLEGNPQSLRINRDKVPIIHEQDTYRLSQDKHVFIDGEFILSIECKSYTEVAMYKRILVDSFLLKRVFPNLSLALIQLESMLRGDYANRVENYEGSASVRVMNSIFPHVDVLIVTLLDGERHVKRPIHRPEFYKPLNPRRLEYAISRFEDIFRPHLARTHF